MEWVQVVRYRIGDSGEETLVDKPPQLFDDGSPYCFWGPNPTFFDAPATTHQNMRWTAHAFLTFSPDAVMSKVVQPVCGFSWGYEVVGEEIKVLPLEQLEPAAWSPAQAVLQDRYPAWDFGAGG